MPPRAPLWQRLWRRPAFKRGFYELLGLVLLGNRRLQMLNCGYAAIGDDSPPLALLPAREPERPGYALYSHLVAGLDLSGKDVLEVGCGRGAGARFLAETHNPRSYVATDASRMLVMAGRRPRLPANLRLMRASAEDLRFGEASFDHILAVEAMTLVPDKPAFLASVARLLRPGGLFLVADFFYTRPDSPNAAQRFRDAVSTSPLQTAAEETWTPQAVASLEAVSPRRLAYIRRLPAFLRGPALSFAGTTESPLYRQLRDGRASYLHFRLRRPSAQG